MKTETLSRYFQHYLGRQRKLFGIDPAAALAHLNEVMQWQEGDAKKAAGEGTRPSREEQEKKGTGPRRAG
ncbi:hypothetical protein [Chromobacterium paludis]|uniref:Uncharacterized protein n=1 Tax=Chromobacterium paludis TaxID=2605945 RepID=A0A5C1DHH9_9NEIS|nr:hypothetical protein [Chromobacterium paludis]QEL56013.1 hypothetical protein FYK34_10820 [Chromobacterium paludis]